MQPSCRRNAAYISSASCTPQRPRWLSEATPDSRNQYVPTPAVPGERSTSPGTWHQNRPASMHDHAWPPVTRMPASAAIGWRSLGYWTADAARSRRSPRPRLLSCAGAGTGACRSPPACPAAGPCRCHGRAFSRPCVGLPPSHAGSSGVTGSSRTRAATPAQRGITRDTRPGRWSGWPKGRDLLVVGCGGYTGLADAPLGSVSTNCVHHAGMPVTVIRPAARSHQRDPH